MANNSVGKHLMIFFNLIQGKKINVYKGLFVYGFVRLPLLNQA